MSDSSSLVNIRLFNTLPYLPVWQAMKTFTQTRTATTIDEIWLLEHSPVFTQGQAGKAEHILNPHDIPIVQTDRGGQVTYHGPGQLMVYTLLDIKRLNINTRNLVVALENVVIKLLKQYDVVATGNREAPGVYVADAKICSIGLRLRRFTSYHGIALNVAMDLTPFSYINPCGFHTLTMTQIKEFISTTTVANVKQHIIPYLVDAFGYTHSQIIDDLALPLSL